MMLNWLVEQILSWDIQVFQLLNTTWSNPLLDQFMPLFTDLHLNPWFGLVFLPALLMVILLRYRKKAVAPILCALLSMAIADTISYRVIKPLVGRPRPPYSQVYLTLRTNNFRGYGFPSNHAANAFALATILSLFIGRGRYFYFGLAALIGYSRIYVGVHFPLDVLFGAILGIFSGKFVFESYRWLRRRFPILQYYT